MTESTPAQGRDDGAAAAEPTPDRPRWWQRALPATLLAVFALAIAVLALPDDELELSTSRKPQPFVELAMTRPAEEVCAGDTARVAFEVTSHLPEAQRLAWTVSTGAAEETGSARLRPGTGRAAAVRVPAPQKPYDVTVRLADRPEQLRVHCRKGRP